MRLRRLQVDDYPALRPIYMNPNVGYPAAIGAIEDDQTMMRLAAALIHAGNCAMEEDGQVVGVIGHGAAQMAEEGEVAAVIGYVVREDCWGRGYCTQAVIEYSDMLLQVGYDAVYADCFTDNPASARVLEKAGFAHRYDFVRQFPCFAEPKQLHLYKKTAAPAREEQ
ncbi:MAG: GNAT family N-acetyltransferase [Eubacteriales bacterium]|nr:GNAT family N-acetyltransferase [Eubacteriales bacterium]